MMDRKNMNRFRDNLLVLTEKAGLKQVEVARKMGVSNKVVNNWYTGRHVMVIFNLPKLAKALNCTIDDLLEGCE